jgi:Bacterial Ig domain
MQARLIRTLLAASVLLAAIVVTALDDHQGNAAGAATVAPRVSSTGPQCTFNGSSLPLVTGVSGGDKIAINCSGLPVLHPYLVVGASLLLAIDPAAKPLLTGQLVSLGALNALLAALKEIDLASEAFPISDLSGHLSLDWTVPKFQPLDPNASCPPTQQEFNSGLLGCAVAMIDLTTFKPVAAGSALFEYSGFSLLPPNPTLALSASTAVPNQTLLASDVPGATTYWWVSTLAALQAGLGGGSASVPTVAVTLIDPKGTKVAVASSVHVTPATYNGTTFFPPALSGGFVVPTSVAGPETVNIQVGSVLDGLPLANSASAPLFVNNPPTTSIIVPSNRSRLSNVTTLDASATNADSVQFVLFGGPYFGQVIGSATETSFGWIFIWNTKTVPNGSYLLFSEAFNASGSGISAPTKIAVRNRR